MKNNYCSLLSIEQLFRNKALFFLLLGFSFCSFSLNAQNQTKEYYQTKLKSSTTVGYLSYLPPAYTSSTNNFPLMIFLHGMGETGSDLNKLLYYGPPNMIHWGKWPADRPFIVISPQNPSAFGNWWNPALVDEVISEVSAKYRVDKNKIYVTGTSMGGNGAWNYATAYPDRVAALVPICGWGTPSNACNMKNVPTWAFHNSGDPTVNVSGTTNMIDAIEKCSPSPWPKETIYQKSGHDAWSMTYDLTAGHDIYSWMLSHTKSGSTSTNKTPSVNAGSDKTLTLPQNSTSLTGSASDSDGSVSSLVWSKVSGPTVSMSNTSSSTVNLTNLVAGTYYFRLTVKDNSGASAYDDVKVTVNSAPVASPPPPADGQGLKYSYYEGNWSVLPNFDALTPKKSGLVSNFTLSVKNNPDLYGFQFDGYIETTTAGTYTFYTSSDDGSKLYINGKEIVNNDGLHGKQEKSGSIYLAAGKHAIRVTYFEAYSDDILEVKYSGPGITKQSIPSNRLFTDTDDEPSTPPATGTQGLSYSYYEGHWSMLPNFNSLSPKKSGVVSNFTLSVKNRPDLYGFQFDGYIETTTAGTYTFYTSSDDGSKLYINGSEIVNNDGAHGNQEKSGSIYLAAGMHAIKVSYFEIYADDILEVKYSGPGITKQSIPSSRLFTEGGDKPPVSGDQGLSYAYYEGTWSVLPNFSALSAKKTGTITNFSLSPRLRSDLYGFQFEGYIDISTGGDYTFYTSSDDGSKLYIDNKEVVNNDGRHGNVERSGVINLTSGKHTIKVTYFEATGDDVLAVKYAGPGISKQIIPNNKLSTADEGTTAKPPVTEDNQGLKYSAYEGGWIAIPNFDNITAKKSGTVANFDLSVKTRADQYGMQYEGLINITSAGTYNFYITSNDGSKLYINGKEVVNNDGLHGSVEKSGSVYLNAGKHAIKAVYFDGWGNDDVLSVKYAGPGISKKAIPDNVLSYNSSTTSSSSKFNGAMEIAKGNDEGLFNKLNVYPNPFEDEITVSAGKGHEGKVQISIVDLTGKVYYSETVEFSTFDGSYPLRLSNTKMATGVYLLQLRSATKKEVVRIIKK